MKTLILTEIVNCGKIGSVMLESFHNHHPYRQIHIVGTLNDFSELGEIGKHKNNIFIDITSDTVLLEKYKRGHAGSAHVFALALSGGFDNFGRFIHIDSDLVFKREAVSIIENALDDDADIVGSLRCYGNNPSGIKNLDKYPDTVSTYFMGINLWKVPHYSFDKLCDYCQGGAHPLGYPVLDFFDGVTHATLANGGKIKYIRQEIVGGQNKEGNKKSIYPSNMHMDMGSHLVHFGGVGSGYAVYKGISNPQKSYADWAVGKYAFFAKQFFGEDIGYDKPTVYTPDGRWCDGIADEQILWNFKTDMER